MHYTSLRHTQKIIEQAIFTINTNSNNFGDISIYSRGQGNSQLCQLNFLQH
ncbi:hypothetical protein FDUTEX481_00395 [Tolypothrix sp. PCC 7601]|nr:hypothetical protein FDUTEX481_00395 [Tolypothrix sp. PCC 7601]